MIPFSSADAIERQLTEVHAIHATQSQRYQDLNDTLDISNRRSLKICQGFNCPGGTSTAPVGGGDATCDFYSRPENGGISCRPDPSYVAPLSYVGISNSTGSEAWVWQRALSGVFVDKVCLHGWMTQWLVMIEFFYQGECFEASR